MSDEKPTFQVVSGFNGGVSVGIYADTFDELQDKFIEAFNPEDGPVVLDGLMQQLVTESHRAAKGVAAEAQSISQPQAAQSSAPNPNGPPPGQTADPKDPSKTKWVPAGVSKKTGKPYQGFWTNP